MPQHITGLRQRLESLLASQSFQLALINSGLGFGQQTGLAEVLADEPLVANGYAPQPFTYTANSATFDAGTGWLTTPGVNAVFSATTAYNYSHIVLIGGRSGPANQLISSVNTSTDQLTVTAHGRANGDRAVIRSTGTLPGGAVISGGGYYVKSISANVIELYTDAALTSKVNLTSAGAGTLYLQNCNGAIYEYLATAGTINPGQTRTFQFAYRTR